MYSFTNLGQGKTLFYLKYTKCFLNRYRFPRQRFRFFDRSTLAFLATIIGSEALPLRSNSPIFTRIIGSVTSAKGMSRKFQCCFYF